MNRIQQLFQTKEQNILSVYFCAGHPTLDSTVPCIEALQQGGVDMVEVGIPFSDPLADGPTIQGAASKALKNGMSLHKLFCQLEGIRKKSPCHSFSWAISIPFSTLALKRFAAVAKKSE